MLPFYDQSSGDYGNIETGFSRQPSHDFSTYAKGYYLAAKQLADELLGKNGYGDHEGYPIVFLYRHSLELYLKSFIFSTVSVTKLLWGKLGKDSKNTHDLPSLYGAFVKLVDGIPEFKEDANLRMFLRGLKSVVKDFHEIDPRSDSFRYPLGKDGKPIGKMWLKIGDIRDTFEELEPGLDSLAVYVDVLEEGVRDAVLEEYFNTMKEEAEQSENLSLDI